MTDRAEDLSRAGCIDLHSHTTASDGSFSPQELVELAARLSLRALAITDHDTFSGYEQAHPFAQHTGLDLVRGIELNARYSLASGRVRSVHVLIYFPNGEPAQNFIDWLAEQRAERNRRNSLLIDALRSRAVDITLEEVESIGRSLTGRPHFARVLVEKGYATGFEDAFRKYLGEDAPSFVERESETVEEVVRIALKGKGIPVVAHPIRIGLERSDELGVFRRWKEAGLTGLEVFHPEHSAALQAHYLEVARELGLLPTGGSDFHGSLKPTTELGSGIKSNIRVPIEFLEGLRRFVQ